jgi:hypothetical protein
MFFRQNNKWLRLLVFLVSFVIAGCGVSEEKFEKVKIGDSRESVFETLGKPDTVSSIEAPLFSGQRLTWKATDGRIYAVTIAMGRVVAKTVE